MTIGELTESQLPTYCHRSCEKEGLSINIRPLETDHHTVRVEETNERVWLMQQLENIGEMKSLSLKRYVSIGIKFDLQCNRVDFIEQL